MENNKKKQILIVVLISLLVVSIVGITFASFTYSRSGTSNSKQIVGDIYMHYTESNQLTLENAMPSTTYDPTKYFEFTIDGKNTNTKYDIIYDVTLNRGDNHQTRTTRLDDKFLKFTLMEKKPGESEWTTVVDSKSYSDLSSGIRVWKDTITKNTMNEVVHTYRLYMWIDNSVVIGNTNEADYDLDTWNDDVYASVKVTVTGDFEDKELYKTGSEKVLEVANSIPNCTRTVTDTDGTVYISGKSDKTYIYSNAATDDCVIDFNYVWWSGKMWRITAIYPDGSMKLITDNNITSIAFNDTVTYYDKTNSAKSYMFQWLNEDFLDILYNGGRDVIDTTKYWNATMPADTNISTKPEETDATMISTTISPIGLLNSYEYYKSYQNTTYGNGYLNIGYFWWLLNPYSSSHVWYLDRDGFGSNFSPLNANGSRPSVYLKSEISLSGSGTKESPYRLSDDYDEANTDDKVYTRHSGEYIKFDTDGSSGNYDNAPLFRIVGVEGEGNTRITKIVAMDYASNSATKQFASSVTYGANSNTQSNDYWDYYLNNDWYDNLSFKEKLTSGNYYLGLGTSPYYNYKKSICSTDTTDKVSSCTKQTSYPFMVGLLRYGEMFATQQGRGYRSSSNMWLITKNILSYVWHVNNVGNCSSSSPTYTLGLGSRPSYYLKSEIRILSGIGTENSPYIVS